MVHLQIYPSLIDTLIRKYQDQNVSVKEIEWVLRDFVTNITEITVCLSETKIGKTVAMKRMSVYFN